MGLKKDTSPSKLRYISKMRQYRKWFIYKLYQIVPTTTHSGLSATLSPLLFTSLFLSLFLHFLHFLTGLSRWPPSRVCSRFLPTREIFLDAVMSSLLWRDKLVFLRKKPLGVNLHYLKVCVIGWFSCLLPHQKSYHFKNKTPKKIKTFSIFLTS